MSAFCFIIGIIFFIISITALIVVEKHRFIFALISFGFSLGFICLGDKFLQDLPINEYVAEEISKTYTSFPDCQKIVSGEIVYNKDARKYRSCVEHYTNARMYKKMRGDLSTSESR